MIKYLFKVLKIYTSFFIDLYFAFALFYFFFDKIQILNIRYFNNIYADYFLLIYLINTFLRIIQVLFFSKTIGQFILKIKTNNHKDNNFYYKLKTKVLLLIRSIIETITLPLFIELFRIFKTKSISEIISKEEFHFQKVKYRLKLLFILSSFFVTFFYLPLLYRLDYPLKKLKFNPMLNILKLKKNTNFSSFKLINSTFFNFSTFTNYSNNRFLLLPSFDIYREKNKTIASPFMIIYDSISDSIGVMKIIRRINIQKFSHKFNYYLDSKRQDNSSFLLNILNCDITTFHNYFLQNIFLSSSYLLLKKKVFSLLNIKNNSGFNLNTISIGENKIGDKRFIELHINDLNISEKEKDFFNNITKYKKIENKKLEQIILIALNEKEIPFYSITWEKNLDFKISSNLFRRDLLSQSKWNFSSYKKQLTNNIKIDLDAFYILDIMFKAKDIDKSYKRKILKSYLYFFKNNYLHVLPQKVSKIFINKFTIYVELFMSRDVELIKIIKSIK